MDNLFQNKYRITSARIQWHEYDGGAYYVTICTDKKIHYFGEIADGKMKMTVIGQYTHENLHNITAHYPYAEIPSFVVMPNHVHAIIFIDNNKIGAAQNANQCCSRDAINRVSNGMEQINQCCSGDAINRVSTPRGGITAGRNPMLRNCLGAVIRGMKARVSHYARQNSIAFAWQPRFYDHIIRNYHEVNHIAEYIENNVVRWDLDELYG